MNLIAASVIAFLALILFIGNWVVAIFASIRFASCDFHYPSLTFYSMFFNIVAMFAVFWLIGWDLGVVETVGMSLMVGLACDYVFHMAEAYVHAKRHVKASLDGSSFTERHFIRSPKFFLSHCRFEATRIALVHMGSSVLGGALTTVLSSSILMLTTIQIFTKFGIIVSVTLALSLIYTMLFFCSLMMLFGPRREFGDIYPCANSL